MITITVDNKQYQVEPQGNLLETCLHLGFDIPHFCFHPALGSVGACRLCAVKRFRDDKDTKGRIIMSCMEPVSEGMIISTFDDEVKHFRDAVIESIMTNHPHDCPICDEGGECHLQDMVVMTGHNYRRFEFKKNTYINQNLGPYINHEMNRCIQCYRCVRYYKGYAGGKDFGVFGTHNHLYFGRFEDGQLESPFSGNLIEVCPTGVFTDKKLKQHYTRKWDLTNAPSLCTHCSAGCNILVGERYGEVRRILNRYNHDVNGYFLCDRGRFGYEFINAETRIKKSYFRQNKGSDPSMLNTLDAVQKAISIVSSGKVIGIGSPNSSLEANYALQKLVGKNNFFAGIDPIEFSLIKNILKIYQSNKVHVPSLIEIEKAEAVIIFGEDILKTSPRLALAVRQSVKTKPFNDSAKLNIPQWHNLAIQNAVGNSKGPLFILTPTPTNIDDIATKTYRDNSGSIAHVGDALTSLLNQSPLADDITDVEKHFANQINESIKDCKSVMIITGTQQMDQKLIDASFNLAISLQPAKKVGLYCVVPECNSLGLGILSDKNLEQAFESIEKESADTLIILENDLIKRIGKAKVESAFAHCKNIIALDHTMTDTAVLANLVLASGTFSESEGTLVNSEGRMQRYFSVFPPNEEILQSWKWLSNIFTNKNNSSNLKFQNLIEEIALDFNSLTRIKEVSQDDDFRINGMKIPRQTKRFSGRTSMKANINISEPKPPQDENSPLAFSMEGSNAIPPAELTTFFWAPGWNSVQATYKYLKDENSDESKKDFGIRIFK